jgi:hypothetical protein
MQYLFFCIAWLFTFLTLIGLYKPWVVFWWADFSNRKKVLKIYGTALVVCWALFWLFS